jgi:undecaprenyl-phosphate 4-deoxy-4-formamido-L-arabinose transferase
MLYGAWLVLHRVVEGTVVPGWTTIAVLLSVFAGFIIALLSMIGEYVVRTLNTVSTDQTFHVVKRVGRQQS